MDYGVGRDVPFERFQALARQVASEFFTMDVARRIEGEWIVVELGDGQVAGLPDNGAADFDALQARLTQEELQLTQEELEEQLANFLALLEYPNYTLCLTPEASDIPYEIRGPEVRFRADRRNKGHPRAGRVSGVVIRSAARAEQLEVEFWTMFRMTEPEFRDKRRIAEWLTKQVRRYRPLFGRHGLTKPSFDVFLCHNSADVPQVRSIGGRLIQYGISPWFAEWDAVPGRPRQQSLEDAILRSETAAVFVGPDGVGPWQDLEVQTLLRQFVSRGCPVIPVVLPNATSRPPLPLFLENFHWVDFRVADPNPLDQLVWGITGRRPS